jgi:hypothetical protein
MYNLKWKIYDIKRTPVKKKIFSRQKRLRKMRLKNNFRFLAIFSLKKGLFVNIEKI